MLEIGTKNKIKIKPSKAKFNILWSSRDSRPIYSPSLQRSNVHSSESVRRVIQCKKKKKDKIRGEIDMSIKKLEK